MSDQLERSVSCWEQNVRTGHFVEQDNATGAPVRATSGCCFPHSWKGIARETTASQSSHDTALRQFDQRLALDDGVVVGKGVEGLNEEAAAAGLNIDVAQSPKRHTAAGIKLVQHAFSLTVVA